MIKENKNVILKAFSSQFIIPDFKSFCESIKTIFHECEGDAIELTVSSIQFRFSVFEVQKQLTNISNSNPSSWFLADIGLYHVTCVETQLLAKKHGRF